MGEKKISRGGIIAVACFIVLIFVPAYAQFQLSPLAHLVMPTYNLDKTQFSMLFSAAMIVGIVLSLVAGILCDKFGIKRTIGVAGIITAVSLIGRIFAPDFTPLFICMVGTGFVATFLNANLAKIMGAWFTPDKVGIAVGIASSGMTLGMAIGMGTSALFPSLNSIFVFTAVLGVIAALVWWVFYKDNAANTSKAAGAQHKQLQTPPLSACLKVVTKSRNVWLIGIILGMCMAATMCITTFMPQILAERGYDAASAGAMSSIITYGSLAGAIFAPIIRARFGAFKPVAAAFAILAAVCTATAWIMPDGPLMAVVFFLTGFSQNGLLAIIISLPVLLPEIGPVYAGTAGGLAATMQLIGAVVIPTYILTPMTGSNFFVFYLIAGVFCIIAAVCVFALPELFGKKAAEK